MGGRGGTPAAPATQAGGPSGSTVDITVRAVSAARNTSSYPYLSPGERTVADVRDALARQGITGRAEQDAALKAAMRAGKIDIHSAIATYQLSRREVEEGIMLGGQMDHIVSPRST